MSTGEDIVREYRKSGVHVGRVCGQQRGAARNIVCEPSRSYIRNVMPVSRYQSSFATSVHHPRFGCDVLGHSTRVLCEQKKNTSRKQAHLEELHSCEWQPRTLEYIMASPQTVSNGANVRGCHC